VLSERVLSKETLTVAVHVAASLAMVTWEHNHSSLIQALTTGRASEQWEVELIMEFFRELADKYSKFQQTALPECLSYCSYVLEAASHQDTILHFLTELCLNAEEQDDPLSKSPPNSKPISDFIMEILKSWREHIKEERIEKLWSAIVVSKYFRLALHYNSCTNF